MSRVGRAERTTKETSVVVEIDLDGHGKVDVSTGVGFYDHMLDQLGRHGLFDLTVKTEGDLHIDSHHTIEDTALALGAAFKQALGDKVGIYRFGNCTVPLDESLAQVTVDLSGRPYLVHTEPENMAPMIGSYDTTMTRHILESFVAQAQIALHVHVPYGRNAHHIVECQFKALARALRYAAERDPRAAGILLHEGRPQAHDRPLHHPHRRRSLPRRRCVLLLQAEDAHGPDRAPRYRIRDVPGRRCPADSGGLGMTVSKKVVVLDYGFGNVRSAERALARVGADVEITRDYDRAMNADGLLVPGVGAFAACMDGLKKARGEWIIDRRLSGGRPVMGICVGMQILFARGIEHGVETEGLDEWPGTVGPLTAPVVPHMGWNTVEAADDSRLFAGVDADARFYFVHSYAVHAWDLEVTNPAIRAPQVTWATHGERFVAAVENGALWATQFHPEKSGDAGAQLLTNWIETL